MDTSWPDEFGRRMRGFSGMRPAQPGQVALSIKVRVASGCFHREHSPYAYAFIDEYLRQSRESDQPFDLIEHESGPEILVYVAATTAGIALAKSVIDLIVTILKARSESVKRGDRPREPLELIVRRSVDGTHVEEEVVLRVGHTDAVDHASVERQLVEALKKLLRNGGTAG